MNECLGFCCSVGFGSFFSSSSSNATERCMGPNAPSHQPALAPGTVTDFDLCRHTQTPQIMLPDIKGIKFENTFIMAQGLVLYPPTIYDRKKLLALFMGAGTPLSPPSLSTVSSHSSPQSSPRGRGPPFPLQPPSTQCVSSSPDHAHALPRHTFTVPSASIRSIRSSVSTPTASASSSLSFRLT